MDEAATVAATSRLRRIGMLGNAALSRPIVLIVRRSQGFRRTTLKERATGTNFANTCYVNAAKYLNHDKGIVQYYNEVGLKCKLDRRISIHKAAKLYRSVCNLVKICPPSVSNLVWLNGQDVRISTPSCGSFVQWIEFVRHEDEGRKNESFGLSSLHSSIV